MRVQSHLAAAGVAIASLALTVLVAPDQARASESGASIYLLGSGGPGAAVMPPVPGVFLSSTGYYYKGETDGARQFPIGGHVVAGLDATIAAVFPTMLWVPDTTVAGGRLGFGMAVPLGQPWVEVSAVLTGPRGRQVTLRRKDTAFVQGDPIFLSMIGWKRGEWNYQLSGMTNIPVGAYRSGELANLAFHRWAQDVSFAVTWKNQPGWDLSAKTGFTFNGENPITDYNTGTEWHVEAAVEKAITPAWSLGLQAYHFDQVTGDSGAGAALGSFKGRVTAVGATAAYNFKIMGKIPATLRLHGFSEFGARNRLEGDSLFLDFSMPLSVKLPPGVAH